MPFSRYRKTCVGLFEELLRLHESPGDLELGQDLQLRILARLMAVERRSRKTKIQEKELRRHLGSRKKRLSKEGATKAKEGIAYQRWKREEYGRVLHVLRSIGDGVAFTYLDRFDIKPMRMSQSAGYISGRSGLAKERSTFREAFSIGAVAILNDITTCLRHGDVTVVLPSGQPALLEVKSSQQSSGRARRQAERLEQLAKYLNEDVTSSFFGPERTIKRVSSHSEILEHSGRVTEMLARLDGGYWLEEVEPGLVYLVENFSSFSEDGIKAVTSLCKAPPIVFFLNQMKWDAAAYVPFSLTLRRPEALFAFYEGEIGVIVAFDPSRFISRLRSFGVAGEFIDDDEYAVEVRAAQDGATVRVSRHFFSRVATEFVSLDWMARECASFALRARGDSVSAV